MVKINTTCQERQVYQSDYHRDKWLFLYSLCRCDIILLPNDIPSCIIRTAVLKYTVYPKPSHSKKRSVRIGCDTISPCIPLFWWIIYMILMSNVFTLFFFKKTYVYFSNSPYNVWILKNKAYIQRIRIWSSKKIIFILRHPGLIVTNK